MFFMYCVAVMYCHNWYIPLRCSPFCSDNYCFIDNNSVVCLVILLLHSNNVTVCYIILVVIIYYCFVTF